MLERELPHRISNTELDIMQAVWANDGQMNYSQIWSVVGHNAKQTTQTLITRLLNKGVLKQEKREVYYYSPLVSKDDYRKAKTKELIERAYSGCAKSLVAALLEQNLLTRDDIGQLVK